MDNNEDMLQLEHFLALNQFDEAISYVDELIDKKCDYLDEAIVLVVSELHLRKKFLDKAYQLIRDGLTLFPDSTSLQIELCLNLQLRGFQKEALDFCRQLAEANPSSVEIWFMLSELYCDYGAYENAVETIDYAITCAKDYENGIEATYHLTFMKTRFLMKNGSYFQAISCLIELMSYDEYSKAQVDPRLAECYIRIGDYETAFDLLNGLIGEKEIEDEIAFYGNLIFCCLHTDRQIIAIDILAEALKKYPHILEYITTLNILRSFKTETELTDDKIINAGELVRKLFTDNTHFN